MFTNYVYDHFQFSLGVEIKAGKGWENFQTSTSGEMIIRYSRVHQMPEVTKDFHLLSLKNLHVHFDIGLKR